MSTVGRLFDVRTPMRDGIELSADVWLPDGDMRSPLILIRTPYLKSAPPAPDTQFEFSTLARYFAEKGYALAVQDVRGRGDSDGTYGYYFQEGQDGYDTIEWMATQPWCNGRVGTMGVSYQGTAQWLAASLNPSHLVCMATAAAPGDFMNELPYVGGAFLQNRLWWANYVSGRIVQGSVREDEWAAIFQHRPLLTADEAMGRKMPLYREWLKHPTLDGYWKRLLLTEEDYRRINIPILHITGWFDSSQAGVMRHWQGMAAHSPAAAAQYLVVGPWEHAQTFFGGVLKVGELELTSDSTIDINRLHLEFFDRYLRQVTSDFTRPRAQLYMTGANEWRYYQSYPVADSSLRRLYLSSDGRANSMLGDGRLVESAPDEQAADHYVFDPRCPVPLDPVIPGALYGVDRRPFEYRDDILVYSGRALEEPLEIIGRAWLELYAASDARDTDFTASLIDVYPDGRAVVLGSRVVGIIRARHRKSLEREELLTPGTVERYEIDLGHLAHTFLSGHCIRVEISSSAAPMYNPNQNTGNPVATDTEWRNARQTIYHDARCPSALVLPVVAG